jgi:hypothetical protein
MKAKKIIVAIAAALVVATATLSLGASRSSESAAREGEVRLFGAGCPKTFTDFTNQRWCLNDVSPDEGAIQTCSYNDC